jgi:hypothetical protein
MFPPKAIRRGKTDRLQETFSLPTWPASSDEILDLTIGELNFNLI